MHPISYNNYSDLLQQVSDKDYSKVVVIVDEHTKKYCLPRLLDKIGIDVRIIDVPSGERYKTIATCTTIWQAMLDMRLDRHALCINLGGGVIGDMGGFCAATYMRGIDFVQVPTTLLAQVDASVGGKLGVDFGSHKNYIGLIQDPTLVVVDVAYLDTLPAQQLTSGYGEVLKHGLIADAHYWQQTSKGIDYSPEEWTEVVRRSIDIKSKIVSMDPREQNVRKILNYGHTVGHAVESMWLDSVTPLLHGEAVAIGMIVEGHLSYQSGILKASDCDHIAVTLVELYGHHPSLIVDFEAIIALMYADKKNRAGTIRCTLLDSIGSSTYDRELTDDMIRYALQYYRDL